MRLFVVPICVLCATGSWAAQPDAKAEAAKVEAVFRNIRATFTLTVDRSAESFDGMDPKGVEDNPSHLQQRGEFLELGDKKLTRTVSTLTQPNGDPAMRIDVELGDARSGIQATSFWVKGVRMTSQRFEKSFYNGFDPFLWCYGVYGKPLSDLLSKADTNVRQDASGLEISGSVDGYAYKAHVDPNRSFMITSLEIPGKGVPVLRRITVGSMSQVGGIWVPQDYAYEVLSTSSEKPILLLRQAYRFTKWKAGKVKPQEMLLGASAGTFVKEGENGPVSQIELVCPHSGSHFKMSSSTIMTWLPRVCGSRGTSGDALVVEPAKDRQLHLRFRKVVKDFKNPQ